MSVIWKELIWPADPVRLPLDAKLLHVGVQGNAAFVWFETCGVLAPVPTERIQHTVTGAQRPEGSYLGTVLLHEGEFVLHFYDAQNGKTEYDAPERPHGN